LKIWNKLLFLAIIVAIFFYLIGSETIVPDFAKKKTDLSYLDLFSKVASLVETQYVEPVEADKKYPQAFSAMLDSLDQLSAYLNQNRTRLYNQYQQNSVFGIGVFGIKNRNYFLITDVVENSPAHKAGLIPGDYIKAVNEKGIFSKSFWEMVLAVKTLKSQSLTLTIIGKGTPEKERKLTCNTYPLKYQSQIKKLSDNVHLIRIRTINKKFVEQIKVLLTLKSPVKVVFDLRGYVGGDFNSLKQVCHILFDSSTTITLKTRTKTGPIVMGSANPLKYKAVVIINGSSIIYNDLLAALFKSYKDKTKAAITLIGRPTAGLVTKSKHIVLEDNSSLLLTEGFFLLNGEKLFLKGVKPDISLNVNEFKDILKKSVSILNSR